MHDTDIPSEKPATVDELAERLASLSTRDYRDDLCTIAYAYHQVRVQHVDPDAFLRQVAARTPDAIAKVLADFVNRKPQDKSLAAFHLRVTEGTDVPRVQMIPEWQAKRPLLAFYNAIAPDHARRLITDIWAFAHDRLESQHDFIQWLFPLDAPSPVNPLAPVLDKSTINNFLADPELRRRMLKSLDLMLAFYGLQRTEVRIAQAGHFQESSSNWLRPGNHNHHRLTRILRCLTLCGLETEARALLTCLLEIAHQHPRAITSETLRFWQHALT